MREKHNIEIGRRRYDPLRLIQHTSNPFDSRFNGLVIHWRFALLCAIICGTGIRLSGEELFSIATYNVENYLVQAKDGRRIKPLPSRRVIWNSLLEMNADVVVMQELGSMQAMQNIQTNLISQGLEYPHAVFSETPNSPIHLGMLSKRPVDSIHHHTTNVFVLYGRAFRSSRAFLEVDIKVKEHTPIKIFAAHLKSKRPVPYADQWDLRTREALMLRKLIETRMKQNPKQFIAVLGDFNDTPSSQTLKFLKGPPGKQRLTDARPYERSTQQITQSNALTGKRHSVWTHFYDAEDLFSRVDYILMNRNLARIYQHDLSYVMDLPNWGMGSDHRPVLAIFELR